MTTYTYSQLEGLWEQAGGSRTLAPVMAAIAMAESGGSSTAYNPSGASGLWQILGAVNPSDQANLFNPTVNAHEAVLKYNSQGLGAWTTYTSGAYKQYLQGGISPTPSGAPPLSSQVTQGAGASTPGGTAAPSASDLSSLLGPVKNLLHAVATVLDYAFTMFEPGQGPRLLFAAVALVAGFLSYKVLAVSGGAPHG